MAPGNTGGADSAASHDIVLASELPLATVATLAGRRVEPHRPGLPVTIALVQRPLFR